jgi:hypothetical protein
MAREVSQPTVSTQEMTAGNRLPRTPKMLRLVVMVGADARLPTIAMTPQKT